MGGIAVPLSDDDVLLATAARFLFEIGQDEAAQLLLTCSLNTEQEEGALGLRRRLLLTAPTEAFKALSNDRGPITVSIKSALNNVIPRGGILFGNQLDVVVGFLERDPKVQSELFQFAHGDDAPPPVIEAPPSRQGTPHLLVTPLSIFPVEQVRKDDRLCFVIMPFGGMLDDVYEFGIKLAVEDVGLKWQRADDIHQPGSILSQIWTALLKARYVIADLTGTNGNVLYELGLAHALGHSVILLTQDMEDVPFDLRPQRHIVYQGTSAGIKQLRTSLGDLLHTTLAVGL